MTGINDDGIRIDREIAAPPEAVFAALTTADSFARWFGGDAVQVPADRLDYRAEAGRGWAAVMVLPDGGTMDWAGTFIEVDAPMRLDMTITDQPDAENGARLTFELAAAADGEGTRLMMTQQAPGFSDEQKHATIAGWQGFLDVLAQIAAA